MRSFTRVSLALVFATALFGQYRPGTPVFTGGFSNPVYPAGTSSNFPGIVRFTPNPVYPASGGPHLNVPGQRPNHYTGTGPGVIAVPLGYPVYVGSGYDTAPAQPSTPAQPGMTVVYPPAPAPVIVPQFGPDEASQQTASADNPEPVNKDDVQASEDQSSPDHYLIALKDHTVYSVIAYWVQDATLHYFTAGNVHNQVSLSLVDRPLTLRLNKELGANVNLPGTDN
jgi:hypothetical protein